MENYSKYNLIKAILASNLEEGVKEALVNSLISVQQLWQPVWYNTSNNDTGYTIRNLVHTGDKQ